MRQLLILLLFGLASSMPALAYQSKNIATVQQALSRLGLDPGPVDGAWGGKTRTAANQLRARHGLPSARDMTGSTLQLAHRLAP